MATYTKTGEWELDYAAPFRQDGGKQPTGAPYEAADEHTWIRDTYTIILHRVCQGLLNVEYNVGQQTQGSEIQFTGGANTRVFAGELSAAWFTATENTLTQELKGTDIWREHIRWDNIEDWQEVYVATQDGS